MNQPLRVPMKKPAKMSGISYLVAAAAVVVVIAAIVYVAATSQANNIRNAAQLDPYANLGNATFALISPGAVLAGNQGFVALAKHRYSFLYANASNFTSVSNSTFIVIVVGNDTGPYAQLALKAVNRTVLAGAFNYTRGAMMSASGVWSPGQTVFVLAGYNSSALSSALQSFFVRSPPHAPALVAAQFVNASSGLTKRPGDPLMDAYLGGTYELGPHDTSLSYPYNYYDNFAYLLYYAPVITSMAPGIGGNSSGLGLPMTAPVCIPPPPPPEGGSSICVGDYAAMPMLQVGASPPSSPQWSYDTGDCTFFGISDCIDAEGWAASGTNPQLPYAQIPSVYFGVTETGSPIPPSMTGTFGPVSSVLPITWWLYGPDSYGESTGGFQSSTSGAMNESETKLLIKDGVEMFSTPTGETPMGNFTFYNATGAASTYTCGSEMCGMRFNYSIYALLNITSTIPQGAAITMPQWYSQSPQINYSAVLEPVTLSTPKIVKTSSNTYYFSYWSVYSELAGNQYYLRFNTSNATFQLIGPTQAQAIYTTAGSSQSGSVSFTAKTALNVCVHGTCPISGVNITFRRLPSGAVAYTNITGNSTGYYVTPILQAGCYNVSAYKPGYLFYITPNPSCINSTGGLVEALDKYLYVFNVAWPSAYPFGTAPVNTALPISMSLGFYDGQCCASGIPLQIKPSSGYLEPTSVNGTTIPPPTSSGTGTVHFTWHTGNSAGPANIMFTVNGTRGLFISNFTYSMPIALFSGSYPMTVLNISLSNSSVQAAPGSSFADNITVRLCKTFSIGRNRTLPCIPMHPYGANMSLAYLNDRPANTTTMFVPNPAVAAANSLSDATTLHVSVGRGARLGPYTMLISARMQTANATYNTMVRLPLRISLANATTSSTTTIPSTTTITGGYNSSDGALNVTVLFNGAPAPAAAVAALPNYSGWYTGSNGAFYSGFTVKPGSYEVVGTYSNISNSTGYATVNAGSVTSVTIRIYGSQNSTTTATTSATTSSSSTQSTTQTTVSGSYYQCNYCYRTPLGGFSCPQSCPNSTSCYLGGFECT